MEDIQLRVSPDELRAKAGEIEQQIANSQRYWNELSDIVRASGYYWEGEAGDSGRRLMEELMQDVRVIIGRLKEHPPRLLEMAGIYIDADAKAATLANVLPDNVLQ